MSTVTLCGRGVAAAVFDTDGVVTDTATVHFAAWRDVFDEVLRARDVAEPFTHRDYLEHVDGVGRYDGVRRFLTSRGIELPQGEAGDPPERETVCGVGNRKNARFLTRLRADGAPAYDGTVTLLRWLRDQGVPRAVISASRNAGEVLAAAGVDDLFDTRVDGVEADRLGLPGKPEPAVFVEAAERLGVAPSRTMAVEDALSGVRACRTGGFGLVVGVDRVGQREGLLDAGADVVVTDLAELLA